MEAVELPQELLLLLESGFLGTLHGHRDIQIAAAGAPQIGNALAADAEGLEPDWVPSGMLVFHGLCPAWARRPPPPSAACVKVMRQLHIQIGAVPLEQAGAGAR